MHANIDASYITPVDSPLLDMPDSIHFFKRHEMHAFRLPYRVPQLPSNAQVYSAFILRLRLKKPCEQELKR